MAARNPSNSWIRLLGAPIYQDDSRVVFAEFVRPGEKPALFQIREYSRVGSNLRPGRRGVTMRPDLFLDLFQATDQFRSWQGKSQAMDFTQGYPTESGSPVDNWLILEDQAHGAVRLEVVKKNSSTTRKNECVLTAEELNGFMKDGIWKHFRDIAGTLVFTQDVDQEWARNVLVYIVSWPKDAFPNFMSHFDGTLMRWGALKKNFENIASLFLPKWMDKFDELRSLLPPSGCANCLGDDDYLRKGALKDGIDLILSARFFARSLKDGWIPTSSLDDSL